MEIVLKRIAVCQKRDHGLLTRFGETCREKALNEERCGVDNGT